MNNKEVGELLAERRDFFAVKVMPGDFGYAVWLRIDGDYSSLDLAEEIAGYWREELALRGIR